MTSKEKEAMANITQDGGPPEPPPGYYPDMDTPAQLVSSFASLNISSNPVEAMPEVDTCLAHLKLLFAIQTLKDDIGNQDGLFGIWEATCSDTETITNSDKSTETRTKPAQPAKVREKRWALFVAIAADRFETWWRKVLPNYEEDVRELTEQDLLEGNLVNFPSTGKVIPWAAKDLPPLDVLMIWHSYMLNPKDFLEDCVRFNYKNLWATGIPWQMVNTAIDTSFNYSPASDAEHNFATQTGRPWANLEESPARRINCPSCGNGSDVAWTTCGASSDPENPKRCGLTGQGYGDGDFNYTCASCGLYVDCDVLRVAKFKRDVQNLLGPKNITLPGTVLDMTTNWPSAVPKGKAETFEQTFPVRLIKKALRTEVLELVKAGEETKSSMEIIKEAVGQIFLDERRSAAIDDKTSNFRSYRIPGPSRVYTRRMLSRYLDNHSPFALDLASAAIRQGVFTEKMAKINWLHSPDSRATMAKCITKYSRFIEIMAQHPDKLAVPTLDVDLAWHTHQLTPASYYVYTVSRTQRFLDHDDKIRDETLGEGFEFTAQTYQEMYKEVYSECTCWYCEAVRTSQVKSAGRIFGLSTADKINEAFHKSTLLLPSSARDPETSSHLSNHSAVRVKEDSVLQLRVSARTRALHRQMLEDSYQKACKQAKKKGRSIPKKELYYDHWGATFAMYSPFMYPVMAYPGLYAGGKDAGTSYGGDSQTGSCAVGTCGVGPKNADCVGGGSCGGSANTMAFV